MNRVTRIAKNVWLYIRHVSGDDAYERYLEHWRLHHDSEGGAPLDRKLYFRFEQERKWNGVRRCC